MGPIEHTDWGPTMNTTAEHVFELRFTSLFDEGRGFSFPCDERGNVDLDILSERARSNYFFARSVIGRELHQPRVRACSLH
jgi:hypothetical protein